jgi:hypothetical protein
MSFNDDFLRAEAIREVRASGCTLPGVAELIVEHHGASAILANTSRIQALGEEVAASDTEAGTKMRALLQQVAKPTKTAAPAPAQITSSKPDESQAVLDATIGVGTGSASDAAASVGASDEAAAAAGNSATESASTA